MASGKVANSLGAEIDSDRMDQRLHQLFDWQYGTKLSSSEVRKLEAKYNDVIDEVSVDNQLDLEDEEQLQQAKQPRII